MRDIRCLILDLDGVIRHWDMDHYRETVASFGLEPGVFAAIAFEPSLLQSAMTGVFTAEEWADEIGRLVAEAHGLDASEVAAAFTALAWSIDGDAVAVVREVRAARRAKVALFSNASTRLEADLDSCQLHGEFDVVFNSARLGIAKPDPEAFRTVARELGCPVEACLFVDDTVPNVEGAREAGMHAEPFTGVDELRLLLQRAGLLPHGAPAS